MRQQIVEPARGLRRLARLHIAQVRMRVEAVAALRRRAFGLRHAPTSLSWLFGFKPSRVRAGGATFFALLGSKNRDNDNDIHARAESRRARKTGSAGRRRRLNWHFARTHAHRRALDLGHFRPVHAQ